MPNPITYNPFSNRQIDPSVATRLGTTELQVELAGALKNIESKLVDEENLLCEFDVLDATKLGSLSGGGYLDFLLPEGMYQAVSLSYIVSNPSVAVPPLRLVLLANTGVNYAGPFGLANRFCVTPSPIETPAETTRHFIFLSENNPVLLDFDPYPVESPGNWRLSNSSIPKMFIKGGKSENQSQNVPSFFVTLIGGDANAYIACFRFLLKRLKTPTIIRR